MSNEQYSNKNKVLDLSVYEEIPLIAGLLTGGYETEYGKLFEFLDASHFVNIKSAEIYSGCKKLFLNGEKKIDLSKLHGLVKTIKTSELVGIIADNQNNLPLTLYDYAIKVKECYFRRKLFALTQNTANDVIDSDRKKEWIEIVKDVEQQLNELSKESILRNALTIPKTFAKMDKELTSIRSKGSLGYKTGFAKLDKLTYGFIIPHIWIIGGYTGTGKTFFTLSMLAGLMEDGARPVLFSTENSATRNLLRMVGCVTGIPEISLMKGLELDKDIVEVKRIREKFSKQNMILYDDVFDTTEIRMLAKKHKVENKSNLIVVDYIQGLNIAGYGGDIYKQMSAVAFDLQKISLELNMGVIGVSQISNTEAMKSSDELMTFKGAGEITAIADVALWLRKGKQNPNTLIGHIKKIRHANPGSISFDFFSKEAKAKGRYIMEVDGDKADDVKDGW